MSRDVPEFVPWLIEGSTTQVEVCEDILERLNNDDTFLKNITSNETWLYGYNVEIKANSSQWENTSVKMECQGRVDCLFFITKEFFVMNSFRNVKQLIVFEVFWRWRESIRSKKPKL